MNFSQALRLAADWQDTMEGNAAARERIIDAVHAKIQELAANDRAAIGALVDRAVEAAKQQAFFRGA